MTMGTTAGAIVLAMLVMAFLVCLQCEPAAGDPRTNAVYQFCNNKTAESGSVLAINFVPSMDNLTSVVTQNGYGTSLVGQGANAVYGLGQCLEDLNQVDCQLCFSEIRSQLPKCYPGIGGRLYLDGCFGRYDNYSFFNETLDSVIDRTICSNVTSNVYNISVFRGVLGQVIGNVSLLAPQNKGYAVASASGSGLTIYALAQCWQVLDGGLCTTCIRSAASSIASCAPADGRALFTGCYLRYSTSLFWNTYPSSSSSSSNSYVLWVILGTVFSSLLLLAGVIVWRKKLFRGQGSADSSVEMYRTALPEAILQSNLNFKYEEVKKATRNFSLSNKIGEGSHGTVYKAVLSDGKEVAVKRLFLNTRQWVDQFYNEVDLVNRVRHKNLVKLLGFSVDGPESMLIYEYYNNKSLDLFIFDESHEKNLRWQQRLDIIQGVAEGLAYLHEESETRIIHRDIKASNILLDEKLKPKITDFGLAKSFAEDQTHLSTAIAGTLGYMAPEYIVHGHLTEKADVYSFGILILEIVTGTRCNMAASPNGGAGLPFLQKIWNEYKAGMVLEKVVDPSIRSDEVVNGKEEMEHAVKIGLLCTQADPSKRPSMPKVVELLRSCRSGGDDLVITDPPFLDIPAIKEEEEGSLEEAGTAEAANLLPTTSIRSLSISLSSTSECFSGR